MRNVKADSKGSKMAWKREEDEILLVLVKKYGAFGRW